MRYTDRVAGYLLLHTDGQIEHTSKLTPEHQNLVTKGLTVIDLTSMAVFNPAQGWEEIPSDNTEDSEELTEVEDEGEEGEEDDYEEEMDEYNPLVVPRGAKRVISPYIVWGYCRGFK